MHLQTDAILENHSSHMASFPTLPENTPPQIRAVIERMYSDDEAEQLAGTMGLRELTDRRDPPSEALVQLGLLPRIVELLGARTERTAFEAAWLLLIIVDDESTRSIVALIEAGAIPPLVRLVDTAERAELRAQACAILAQIAGDDHGLRDAVIAAGALPPILRRVRTPADPDEHHYAIFALRALCYGEPRPAFEALAPAVPLLAEQLTVDDEEAVSHAVRALSYLAAGSDAEAEAVAASGAILRLVELLAHPARVMHEPALHTLGAIVTLTGGQTAAVMSCRPLPALAALLVRPEPELRDHASWMLANLAAESEACVQAIIDACLVTPLLAALADPECRVVRNAANFVDNVAGSGSAEQLRAVLDAGAIPALAALLGDGLYARAHLAVLAALDRLLARDAAANAVNAVLFKIQDAGGLEKLDALQRSPSTAVFEKVQEIMQKYWDAE